jgi:ADP-ribosyl-[dinitrogen reductase] hydrolase
MTMYINAASAKTSFTHPIQIAAIDVGPGMGRIGITFCPGKVQDSALSGRWSRDLDVDMNAIRDWGAVAVVTLVEDHELATLQVAGMQPAVENRHMAWYHLPITDVSAPDERFLIAWHKAGAALRHRLSNGFDIVVHCKGGLGRAGTVAATLLVELGLTPSEAIAMVRAARPGAIETSAQEDFVRNRVRVPGVAVSTEGTAIHDRGIGAMLGLAIGDAIGTTIEFSRRDSHPRLTDMVGGGPFSLEPGQWTDDTAMALALADSLLRNAELDPNDLMANFLKWWKHGAYSCTGTCFDIGITTSQALRRFRDHGDPYAGDKSPNSAGNGSLMRLAPVALAHWRKPELAVAIASKQSRTTHAAPQALAACGGYAKLLALAIGGASAEEVLAANVVASTGEPIIDAIFAGSWRGKSREEIRSSGYVAHSLEAALWCVGRSSTFKEAILLAANLGDDADTTAAITGQLAGAIWGANSIPVEWRRQIAWSDRIQSIAKSLLAL